MRFTKTPSKDVLNAAVGLLSPYVEGLSATSLVEALKQQQTDNDPTDDLPAFVTKEKAAELLSVSPYTVRAWLQQNKLNGKKIGQQWRIPAQEIRSLAAEGGEN